MTRTKVGGQSRRILPEHLMISNTVDAIVTSKQSRAQNYLKQLKLDRRIMSYNQNPNFDQDFVSVIDLSSHSKLHCNYNYLDCVTNFAYPLLKNQYAIYRQHGDAVGYLSWAWFSENSEKDFYNTEKIVTDPDIFNSGTQGWIVDVIAPFGHVTHTVRHASAVARSRGVNPARFKFQRNYLNKSSRRNFWSHR